MFQATTTFQRPPMSLRIIRWTDSDLEDPRPPLAMFSIRLMGYYFLVFFSIY